MTWIENGSISKISKKLVIVYWKQSNRYKSLQLLCYSKGSFVLSPYKENQQKGAQIQKETTFLNAQNDFHGMKIILKLVFLNIQSVK